MVEMQLTGRDSFFRSFGFFCCAFVPSFPEWGRRLSAPIPEGRSSPTFSHQVVTKRRQGRSDKAHERRLIECNTVRTDHGADAVERV